MTNIILCVGNGTRLWPLSRTLMPKRREMVMATDMVKVIMKKNPNDLSFF